MAGGIFSPSIPVLRSLSCCPRESDLRISKENVARSVETGMM